MKLKNRYSYLGYIKLVLWVIRTKIISPKIRLVRFPIDIRGKQYINFGNRLTTGVGCRFEAYSNDSTKKLFFGSDIQVNDYVHISAMESVQIGDGVLMASHIYISDNSHGCYKGCNYDSDPNIIPIKRDYITKPVKIENNVWLGEHVVIMPGVTVGKGSIIGANSVVTKDIPPYTIAVGQPAKPIKRFNWSNKSWEYIK